MAQTQLHEDLSRANHVEMGTEKSFANTFAVVFALFGAVKLFKHHTNGYYWLAAAALIFVLGRFRPQVFKPFNRIWFKFGLLLFKIVNPLVMGILFFLVVTPMGLLLRLMGKDLLKLKTNTNLDSYWVAKTSYGPPPETMKNQF